MNPTTPFDFENFLAHRAALENPDNAAVRDSFASLSKRGSMEIRCPWERRLSLQKTLVELGAFAICLRPLSDFQDVAITALKGQMGARHETGRSVSYLGAALGVMDDDRLLIVGPTRVSEKTAALYKLPPFQKLLAVTEADPCLLARLDTDPLPFACETTEPNAEQRLATLPFVPSCPDAPMTAVYYPGPFSLLALRDGSMLRRGQCMLIRSDLVESLQERDGALVLPAHRAQEAERPTHGTDACGRAAAGRLLPPEAAPSRGDDGAAAHAAATEAWRSISESLRRRLLRMIERQDPYFILTGSDPRDAQGCCASAQVGEANRLVEAGMLSCCRESAAAQSCAVTLYAFAGEITALGQQRPDFAINAAARAAAAAALASRLPPESPTGSCGAV